MEINKIYIPSVRKKIWGIGCNGQGRKALIVTKSTVLLNHDV